MEAHSPPTDKAQSFKDYYYPADDTTTLDSLNACPECGGEIQRSEHQIKHDGPGRTHYETKTACCECCWSAVKHGRMDN